MRSKVVYAYQNGTFKHRKRNLIWFDEAWIRLTSKEILQLTAILVR